MQRTTYEREAGRILRAMLGELAARAGDRDRSTQGLARRAAVASFFSGDVDGACLLWRSGSRPGAAGAPAGTAPFGRVDGTLKAPCPRWRAPQGSSGSPWPVSTEPACGTPLRRQSPASARCWSTDPYASWPSSRASARRCPEFHLLVASSDPHALLASFPAPVRLEPLPWPALPKATAPRKKARKSRACRGRRSWRPAKSCATTRCPDAACLTGPKPAAPSRPATVADSVHVETPKAVPPVLAVEPEPLSGVAASPAVEGLVVRGGDGRPARRTCGGRRGRNVRHAGTARGARHGNADGFHGSRCRRVRGCRTGSGRPEAWMPEPASAGVPVIPVEPPEARPAVSVRHLAPETVPDGSRSRSIPRGHSRRAACVWAASRCPRP
ncbi:MAG: hypothetical protein MZV49_08860 [Rhodopseudomonas palustris]|nr:hypothetical protein [Rhodopseudomonas palustris]